MLTTFKTEFCVTVDSDSPLTKHYGEYRVKSSSTLTHYGEYACDTTCATAFTNYYPITGKSYNQTTAFTNYDLTTTYKTYYTNQSQSYTSPWGYYTELPTLNKKEHIKNRFSQIVKERCAPNAIIRQNSKRKPLSVSIDVREQRARETLKRVIGDQKFVNFVKNGFVSVKAKSGLVYQIFPGHGITHVFDKGNLIERLCVVLQGSFPPTDSLIMRYLLILNNEQQFRSMSISHSIVGHETSKRIKKIDKSLLEIFKELKAG